MPVTALGRYEIAVTAQSDGKSEEIFSESFLFVPLLRIFAALIVLAALAFLIIRPWRFVRISKAWWLIVPLAVGLWVFLVFSVWGFLDEDLSQGFLPEMASLSLVLWIVCRFRKRHRARAFAAGLVINIVTQYVNMMLNMGLDSWLFAMMLAVIVGLLCFLPTTLGVAAVRRKFTKKRLACGLLVAWIVTMIVVTAVLHLATDMPLECQWILFVAAISLPYLIGFFLFASFNPWCRQGLIRALGLGDGALKQSPASPGTLQGSHEPCFDA